VRLENLGGNVQVDTRASDTIRAVNVKGNVELKGRGDDVELQNIAGLVTVNGVYVGEIQLSNLAQPLRWQDPLSSMSCEKLPGHVRMSRGDFNGNNVIGPVRVTAHSSDVQLSEFTQSLDLTLDRGDVDLKPGKNVPKMEVHTRSGDIDLALPVGAKFDLRASTNHGEASNEYGEPLREDESNHRAAVVGSTGGGPELRLETGRGSVTVRKATAEDATPPPEIPSAPSLPKPPKPPNAPLKVEHE
jgi:DUF4097 and DUF4098 domain-containing protein YvlB